MTTEHASVTCDVALLVPVAELVEVKVGAEGSCMKALIEIHRRHPPEVPATAEELLSANRLRLCFWIGTLLVLAILLSSLVLR